MRLDSGKGGPGLPVFNMPNSSPQMFYKMTLKVQGVNVDHINSSRKRRSFHVVWHDEDERGSNVRLGVAEELTLFGSEGVRNSAY